MQDNAYMQPYLTPKAARINRGLDQTKAAKALCISVYVLRRIENGETPLSLEKARDMVRIYGLPDERVLKV